MNQYLTINLYVHPETSENWLMLPENAAILAALNQQP
jgi:hypothetical protein